MSAKYRRLKKQWHCLELLTVRSGGEYTKAEVKDITGRVIEVRFADLKQWDRTFMLEKDFLWPEHPLYVGETVNVLDPSTSDGETVIVEDRGHKVRVPVAILTPVGRHPWENPQAV